jgi:hypothetical protein
MTQRSFWALLVGCAWLLLGCASGTPSHAAPPEPASAVDVFLDLDRDGAMSYEEFVRSLTTNTMEALDGDRDGLLSEAEGSAPSTAESSIELRFSEVDTDGDARLSAKELEAATRKSRRVRILYDAMDADRDDRVSSPESRRSAPHVGLLRIEF